MQVKTSVGAYAIALGYATMSSSAVAVPVASAHTLYQVRPQQQGAVGASVYAFGRHLDVDDDAHEFTADDFAVLTEADLAMLQFASEATPGEYDFSGFFLDDDE